MKAGLPMYDPPELRPLVDAWWGGLARAFRQAGIDDVPDRLDRNIAFDALWGASDLLFAQACGYPMLGKWAGRLEYVATPRYAAPGCDGVRYCSWIVVAADSPAQCIEDLRGARCSINGRVSHSGYNALRALVAPLACNGHFFGSVTVSGSHFDSLLQIQRDEADTAAIDCVSHALFARCRPDVVASSRIIGRTVNAPGLPYVTRCPAESDLIRRMRAALDSAFTDPGLAPIRDALLIAGLEVIHVDAYHCMVDMEKDALSRGYFELD
jgi:ABC-type phosphate/phosphonate transport system substrate-binding protein